MAHLETSVSHCFEELTDPRDRKDSALFVGYIDDSALRGN